MVVLFISLFEGLNLFGIRHSALINDTLAAAMGIVIVIFLAVDSRYVLRMPHDCLGFFTRPFCDPQTFSSTAVLGGTSLAVLTYIGFDGISTLSEEAENPKRNILLATVLVCLITGVLASVEVYAAQLIWPTSQPFPDVDTAFVAVAGRAAGPWLFTLINVTLLVATVGSGMGSQLGAARLLYGMVRINATSQSVFGAIEFKRRIPRNNVLLVGVCAFLGTVFLTFGPAAELFDFGPLPSFTALPAPPFTSIFSADIHIHFSI